MDKAEKSKTFLRECIEEIVSSWQERRKTIRRRWQVSFIFVEWISEGVSNLLKRWAFLDILGHAARFTILVAVIFYFMESGSRQKAKHYQAWQVINAAQGKSGSGGRKEALEDLHKDDISLAGVDISKAHLRYLILENARLYGADLSKAIFMYAKLAKANLTYTTLAGTIFRHADLTGAILADANLVGADLSDANLADADFRSQNLAGTKIFRDRNLTGILFHDADLADADLAEADLKYANLARANLFRAALADANLADANLADANLAEVDLTRANLTRSNLTSIEHWQEIKSINNANIYDAKNPPDGFIEWAAEHGAVSIEDDDEWKNLLRKKMEEKMLQEAENIREDQKKLR